MSGGKDYSSGLDGPVSGGSVVSSTKYSTGETFVGKSCKDLLSNTLSEYDLEIVKDEKDKFKYAKE